MNLSKWFQLPMLATYFAFPKVLHIDNREKSKIISENNNSIIIIPSIQFHEKEVNNNNHKNQLYKKKDNDNLFHEKKGYVVPFHKNNIICN